MDGKQIIKSLKDAIAYAKGDKTKAKSRIVRTENNDMADFINITIREIDKFSYPEDKKQKIKEIAIKIFSEMSDDFKKQSQKWSYRRKVLSCKGMLYVFERMADITDQKYIENNPNLKQKIIDGLNTPTEKCAEDEEW